MSYESDLTSMWKGETAMDEWYSEAVALKEEAQAARTTSKLLYATKELFHRASATLQSAAFYDENDGIDPLSEDEDSTTRNKGELRVSIGRALPATSEIHSPNSPFFSYMFDEDVEDDKGNEGRFVGLKEDFEIAGVDPASPSQNSSIYDAPSPSSADEDDLPATPPSSVLEYAVLGFDGKVIKQETPTYPTFPVAVAASSPFSFAPASPVYSHVSQTSTSIYSAAKSTSSASLPVSFASLLPVSPAYSPLPSPVSFAPVYSVANSIAAVPFFDAEEAEITDATAGFYGGFDVEESPSPYHAPLIDEDAGFGDIRDGCEHFPEQWTDSDTQAKLVAPYKLTGLQTFSEDLELPADKSVKSILKPVSQIAKAAKTCDMGFGYIHRATFVPQLTALSGFSDEVIAKLNGTKRTAPDSIATNENWDDSTYDGDEEDDFEEPQFVKKVRLSDDNTMDVDVIYAPMPSTLTVPNLKHKTSTRSITQSLLHEHVDFSPVIDGYPGQFKALLPPSKIFHPKAMCGGVPKKVTFGDEGHASGLFHHTRFQGGGNTPYSKYSLDFNIMGPTGDDKLLKTIQIADKNHYIAADTKRTVEQDALRRETHFECSFARLENVTVGEYRYYHGNSSIEDYNEGGLCVCWKECFCSDMCSKYADMLCPCAKYLEFEV